MYELSEQVVSQYLYGSNTTPADLTSTDLIRPTGVGVGSMDFDVDEFMTSGAGRFALASQFALIQAFFSDTTVTPGTYSRADVESEYGVGHTLAIAQWNYRDGTDDYLDRTFVFANTLFTIPADVEFVVNLDGSREIHNFAIVPAGSDNFDFVGGNYIENILNVSLQTNIDPSGIGRKIPLNFTGTRTTGIYDESSYLSDGATISSWSGLDAPALLSEGTALLGQLWDDGITKFLDEQGRPIVYATLAGGDTDPALVSPNMLSHVSLGIHVVGGPSADNVDAQLYATAEVVGGAGADTIIGSHGDDVLYGDFEDHSLSAGSADTINGYNGDDYIYGGAGNDVLSGDAGDDHVVGDDGDDQIDGGDDDDNLYGDSTDIAASSGGSDTVSGGSGGDHIYGGGGNDALNGDAGDDHIAGDRQHRRHSGGAEAPR